MSTASDAGGATVRLRAGGRVLTMNVTSIAAARSPKRTDTENQKMKQKLISSRSSRRVASGSLLALLTLAVNGIARAELPSVKFMSAPLVAPSSALSTYGTATTHTTGVPGFSRAEQIKEL